MSPLTLWLGQLINPTLLLLMYFYSYIYIDTHTQFTISVTLISCKGVQFQMLLFSFRLSKLDNIIYGFLICFRNFGCLIHLLVIVSSWLTAGTILPAGTLFRQFVMHCCSLTHGSQQRAAPLDLVNHTYILLYRLL